VGVLFYFFFASIKARITTAVAGFVIQFEYMGGHRPGHLLSMMLPVVVAGRLCLSLGQGGTQITKQCEEQLARLISCKVLCFLVGPF